MSDTTKRAKVSEETKPSDLVELFGYTYHTDGNGRWWTSPKGNDLEESELLPALKEGITNMQSQLKAITAQRDELLAVLKLARKALKTCDAKKRLAQGDDCSGIYEYHITEHHFNEQEVSNALKAIDAAIAAEKGDK